eukprot:TRINITY_DN7426_c0_g1_i11.p1 TRINITY_DN7426_c0_g1~~TRINITY_DN7426_c0_g1_i11.p1  ORF type:complete len:806 (-),score=246.22 TRINITY_DN7426_c0_g1_i11:25-2442(-)
MDYARLGLLCMLFSLLRAQDIVKSHHAFDSEIHDVIWCDSSRVMLVHTENNDVHRSTDNGESFVKITRSMKKREEKNIENSQEIGLVLNIVKSEADSKSLIFIGRKDAVWVSKDCGETMSALNKDFSIAQIKLHPTEPNWMLATSLKDCKEDDNLCLFGSHSLHLTQDLGQTWREVAGDVKKFTWVLSAGQIAAGIPKERIFAVVRKPSGDKLVKTDDFFATRTSLVKDCVEFYVRPSFLFALQTVKGDEVKLLVSTLADGFSKFYKAVFPDIKLKAKNVHILDTSEGVVFVLTTRRPDIPYGRLYISDSTGLRYRIALKHCLKSSSRGADLAKVEGLEGIYMANVVSSKAAKEFEKKLAQESDSDDEWGGSAGSGTRAETNRTELVTVLKRSIRTVITFNKGGQWQYLTPPKYDVDGKKMECINDCYLNLFLYADTMVPVYSQKSAHGIILANGNVNKYRLNEWYSRDIYLSRDGGVSWSQIGQGPHVYDMADHGALLMMGKLHLTTKHYASLLYSWNVGKSWNKLRISSTNSTLYDIFTDPNSIIQTFLVQVLEIDYILKTLKKTSLYTLNFGNFHARQCVGETNPGAADSDFELWTPYGGKGRDCLLGRRIAYTRRKQDSECYNGRDVEFPVTIENCECTEADYECDFGFYRKELDSSSPCIGYKEINYTAPEDCPPGTYYEVSLGYRKITGDTCQGGVSHEPRRIPCPASRTTMSGSGLMILLLLGGIVVVILTVGYIYRNFDEVKRRLKVGGAKKGGNEFRDVRYGRIEAKIDEADDEDIIIQPSSVSKDKKGRQEIELT